MAAHQLDRSGPGEGLDSADVGRTRRFAGDLEQTDLGCEADVRTPAELAGEGTITDLDNPHDVAVLLSEQGHRSQPTGFVQGGRQRVDGLALEDPLVDLVLDPLQLVTRQAASVREVEPQLVRADIGARLMNVAAEPL